MADPEAALADSPADFDSSLAYALHSEMRRLLIVAVVGVILTQVGFTMFVDPAAFDFAVELTRRILGLILAVAGAALAAGGAVGALFKVVVDANLVAAAERT